MKYRIQRNNYRAFEIYEQNKRAPRAYFIPYSDEKRLRATPEREQRYASDLVRVLSGEWQFRYYEHAAELPRELDTAEVRFDTIRVPSTWQRTGYEPPVYLNCPYEFEEAPPELPEKVSAGVYRKTFTIEQLRERTYLISFLGVISCLDLYCNGYHIGYSEGAHNTAEFDLSAVVTQGENEIVAVVHKWSTGSFLECQDMFRENGISRDVLLYDLPKTFLNDIFLRPAPQGDDGYRLQVTAEILGEQLSGWSLEFSIDGLEQTVTLPAKERLTFTLDKLKVTEWNAEQPTLYTAWIRLKKDGAVNQAVRMPIGFKRVEIAGDLFRFNDRLIKFKGVNHHDTDPKTGYCMTYDDYRRDLTLMKSFNVNAIRTSHYPPDPHLLTLADELGFYVVDEADIEAHGCQMEPHYQIDLISNDKKWIPRYLDRVKRMLFRDRNHACVTMWSLGNEAGGHHCQDACYAFLHAVHPEIPVHYEGACRTPVHAYDVYSEMYTHQENLAAIGARDESEDYRKYLGKPFFLCEYCHAMGVGPGGMEEYWDLFYRYDKLMGGCVWEWADHAVDHGEKAAVRWTYGGDHGERKHDGNFCVDGLMYPDRKPHTGAYEMKNIYRPLRAQSLEGNTYRFLNTNRFADENCAVEWLLRVNGLPAAQDRFELSVPAEQAKDVALDLPEWDAQAEVHLTFRYLNGAGEEIAAEQLALQELYLPEALPTGDAPVLHREKSTIVVAAGDVTYTFHRKTGALRYLTVGGEQILAGRALQPNLLRAMLDNDNWVNWYSLQDFGLLDLTCRHANLRAEQDADGVAVTAVYNITAKEETIFVATVTIKILPGGAANITARLEPTEAFTVGELFRFGLTLPLKKEFGNLRYFGLGEKENLPDFKAQACAGIYEATVAATHEPYIKPQDNGNHGQTRWLEVTDAGGRGLRFTNAPGRFSFSAHHYSQAALAAAKHQEELREENLTFLSIDGFMRGTGTSSCGPDTLDPYRIDFHEPLEFEVAMVAMAG